MCVYICVFIDLYECMCLYLMIKGNGDSKNTFLFINMFQRIKILAVAANDLRNAKYSQWKS